MTMKLVMDGAPDRFGLVEENRQRQRQMRGSLRYGGKSAAFGREDDGSCVSGRQNRQRQKQRQQDVRRGRGGIGGGWFRPSSCCRVGRGMGWRRGRRERRNGLSWAVSMRVMLGFAWMVARLSGVRRMKGSSRALRMRGGDGDAVEDSGGGGAVVVVVGAGEAGVEGGDAVIEFAEGADAGGLVGIVGAGEEGGLAAEATEEGAEEFELVEAVDGGVEGVGGGAEVDGGRDSDDGVELGRGGGAEVAG